MSASLPRAILFDLDDTLIMTRTPRDAAWAAVVEAFAPALHPLEPSAVVGAIRAEAQRFFGDPLNAALWRESLPAARRAFVRQAFRSLCGARAPLDEGLADALADRFTEAQDAAWMLSPGALETIEALRAAGVLLALVTNGDAGSQRAKVDRFELACRFDHIQIEGEHGFGKPDPRAYRHALGAVGAAACDCWMVGDNLDWEVAAPQRLGIHAVWYDPGGVGVPAGAETRPDRVIRALSELLGEPRA
ncbi:MAG TPA: HAD family hydrolase [Caulobacteraceae bacterium]|nr:HAD family hydrolase [Caulobacteraceae bacterium]